MIPRANSILLEGIREKLRARQAQELPPDNLTLRTERPTPMPSERVATVQSVFALGAGVPCPVYAWVLRREDAYFAGPGQGWPWELLCYAACRDFLSWARRAR